MLQYRVKTPWQMSMREFSQMPAVLWLALTMAINKIFMSTRALTVNVRIMGFPDITYK